MTDLVPPVATPDGALVLTGERTLPGIPDETYWFARHVAAYEVAAAKAPGIDVLDAGCGEGYGVAMLAEAGASRVVGVDLDPTTVAHVRRTYPTVEAVEAEFAAMPLPDASFGLVVSFQVIEHVWDVPGYLDALRRVLEPRGELLVATPNRLTFTPDSDTPTNPFHVREFTPDELVAELETAGFRVGNVVGLHHGPAIQAVEAVLRRPLAEVVSAGPPETWPAGVRSFVHRIRPSWFQLREDRLDESLDLLAMCRR